MRTYSFRTAGPRLPSLEQLLILGIWCAGFSRLAASPSPMDRALYAASWALAGLAFAASFWGWLVVERVSAEGDEFVLELFVCGVPFGAPRRASKADVLRAGLDKIEYYRPFRSGKNPSRPYSGWAVTLYGRTQPTLRTRLPLNDEDSDALLRFVRGELGHD